MLSLIERAATVLSRQSAAAVSLGELQRILSASGAPASRAVLLRALAAEPGRFRILTPFQGLARGAGVAAEKSPAVAERRARWGGSAPEAEAEEVWVLAGTSPGAAGLEERASLVRLRSTLVALGWALDATSTRDLSRWARLVLEGERFRQALPPDQRGGAARA